MDPARTLILQSHSWQVLRGWIGRCVDSVRGWAEGNGYDYRFLGDEIFDLLPGDGQARGERRTDLARLLLIRDALENGFEQALWLDADVLIFSPEALRLDCVSDHCAFGREIWVEKSANGKWKTLRRAHHAACLFRAGSSSLPFMIDTMQRLGASTPSADLIADLDAAAQFARLPQIGGFSPEVLADLAVGDGPALTKMKQAYARDGLPLPVAADLSASMDCGPAPDLTREKAIERLLGNGL